MIDKLVSNRPLPTFLMNEPRGAIL